MIAVILAGGKGTRLLEKTMSIPKPMVKVGNKPILWHIIKNLEKNNIRRFIIATGFKSKIISEYIKSDKSLKNLEIFVKFSGLNSMTGFRLKSLEKYINEKFFLTYGDGLSNININKLIKFHDKTKSIITLTTVNPPPRWGYILVNRKNKIISFKEKSIKGDNFINAGFMIMEKEVFKFLKKKKNEVLESDCFPRLVKKKKLSAFYHKGFWQCMDTLRENMMLTKMWNSGKAPWKNW